MPDFLSRYLNANAEKHGLPPHFHAALVQGFYVAKAQGGAYTTDAPDIFLRDYILSHTRDPQSALFLSDALIAYLNAPAPQASALPLTRFMAMIYGSLGADAAQFNLQEVAGVVKFYHAFMGQLAAAYHFPVELVPAALGALLERAKIPVPPATVPLCRIVREADFKKAPPAFTTDVTLMGPADVENGLGAGLRYMAEGMKAAGVNFSILNRYAKSGNRAADRRYGAFEAETATSPINIIHINSDMLAENLLMSGPENFCGRYTVGYFLWETSRLSISHIAGVDLVDEVWVPTEFMRTLYAAVTDKPVKLVGCVIEPPPITLSKAQLPVPPGSMDDFTFVFTYDTASRASRKNPMGVVKAFKQAFAADEKVSLLIKTQNADRVGDKVEKKLYAELEQACLTDARIHLVNMTWKAAEVAALLAAADCYVSLHHAEGIGYGMAESMGLGVPVLATEWSGSADFIAESTAYPVASMLVKIAAGNYHYADEKLATPHFWAEPNLSQAAELMHYIFTHPDEAKARALAGQRLMKSSFSPAAVGARMKARLTEISASLS